MPPPPPPPGPPPPPAFGGLPKSGKVELADRSALLSQIRGGAALKKTATNDRSAPVVGKTKSSVINSGGNTSGGQVGGTQKMNGMTTGGMPLHGLFAQGIPTLRHTGGKFGQEVASTREGFNAVNRINSTSHLNAPIRVFGESYSNPASPAALRNGPLSGSSSHGHIDRSNSSIGGLQKKLPFPNDLHARGPPPPPPSADKKPSFGSDTGLNMAGRPSPPSKPPGVTRSASQTSLNSKPSVRKLAPSVKPPPPPKSMAPSVNGPPALPSKPPSVMRRQSFGGNSQLSCHPQPIVIDSQRHNKLNGPPPPPRNVSVPNSLNHMNDGGDQRQAPTVPPPPPPTSRFSNGNQPNSNYRTPNQMPRAPSSKPPPPPMRIPATAQSLSSTLPPPLPQHRTVPPPAPPSQAKALAPQPPVGVNLVPPPPPARNTSTIPRNASSHQFSDTEKRFAGSFYTIDQLPAPNKLRFPNKTYQKRACTN